MKASAKFLIYAILIIALIVLIVMNSGCKSQKPVTETTQVNLPTVENNPAMPWKQDLDESINVGDPINFYNEYKIVVTGKIPVKIKMYQDGKLMFKDSSVTFDYSIPKMTKGEIVNIERKMGKPVLFTVRLDESENNYNHTFFLQPDKSFMLGSKTKIQVNGTEYTVDVGIEGDGTGKNRMMYYPLYDNKGSNISEPASGVPDIIGTKIIKKN